MVSKTLRVAVVQYDIDPTNPQANLAKIESMLNLPDVDLYVLPEVCLTGFSAGQKMPVFEESGPEVAALCELAGNSHLLGSLRIQNAHTYNRALLLSKEGIQARYDKRILFSYWKENQIFGAGKEGLAFSLGGFDISPFICYELRFPELFRAQKRAHIMPVIANWPQERRHHWITLLRARAIENQCYVVGVNRIGEVRGTSFIGDSVIIDPFGQPMLEMHHEEGSAYADLSLEVVNDYRKAFPALDDAL